MHMNLHKHVFNKAEPVGIKVEPLFSVEQQTGNSANYGHEIENHWTRRRRRRCPPPPPTKGHALVRFCGGAGESGSSKWTGVKKEVLAKDLVVLAGEVDEDGHQMADMRWRVGKGKKMKVEKWRCAVLEWLPGATGRSTSPLGKLDTMLQRKRQRSQEPDQQSIASASPPATVSPLATATASVSPLATATASVSPLATSTGSVSPLAAAIRSANPLAPPCAKPAKPSTRTCKSLRIVVEDAQTIDINFVPYG